MNSRERFLFRQSRGARVRQQILAVLGFVGKLLGWALFFWLIWLTDGGGGNTWWPTTQREWKWTVIALVGVVLLIVVLYQLFPNAMSVPP